MTPPPVQTVFANPDPNAAPLNVTQLVQLLNLLVSTEIKGSYALYVVSPDAPTPEDTDKIWFKLDSSGRPLGIYKYYSGDWRRVYTGLLGEIKGYTGSPTANFEDDGRGKVGGDYDGWQICNGNNGSPNLSDKFLIGAHMDDSNEHTGYNSGWQTFVDGTSNLKTGGLNATMIEEKNLPPLDNHSTDPAKSELIGLYIHGNEWKDVDHPGSAVPLVDTHYANAMEHKELLVRYGARPDAGIPQEALPVLPPFYALAWITFIGYK